MMAGRNAHYWANKDERKVQAADHVKKMASRYSEEIQDSIRRSVIYSRPLQDGEREQMPVQTPQMEVVALDSVSAAMRYGGSKTAILNFASYKYPGGGFLNGSSAQEESLCMESTLYNVISAFDGTYYGYNRAHLNGGLYQDRAIYSPDVQFIHGQDTALFDVLTCAAPNYSVILMYGKDKEKGKEENQEALVGRIDFIKRILELNGVHTAILGAYGCGVLMQDPENVAQVMRDAFGKTSVERVVYAIPSSGKSRPNYEAFRKVFGLG